MESNVYIATTRKHLAVGLNTPVYLGVWKQVYPAQSTRPFPRVAVGKGSGNTRLVNYVTYPPLVCPWSIPEFGRR